MTSRKRLLKALTQHSYREGKFTLASGKESDFYINCKRTFLSKKYLALAADQMVKIIYKYKPQAVAGEGLGGISLASATAVRSLHPLDVVLVRKAQKDHGTKARVEMPAMDSSTINNVVLVEDVLTTGESAIKALQALQQSNIDVRAVIALVDRKEGAKERLEGMGVKVESVFKRTDFIQS